MAGMISKARSILNATKTYHVGLLQAKAFRILKEHTTDGLAHANISTTEWAFLGLLYEQEKGIRVSAAAEELGVETPFVTVLTKQLQKRSLVEVNDDPADSRAKLLCLTDAGRTFVVETERSLRIHMRTLVHGASISALLGYISVLKAIIQNEPKKD